MGELIIIGGGPGGYRAAEYAAKNGLKVVLFEGKQVGGTCLNSGCIPTKALARHAEVLTMLGDGETLGLDGLKYGFNFSKVMRRKDEVVNSLRSGVEGLLFNDNVTLVRDNAEFVDSHTVRDTEGRNYVADNIIVATGSVPKSLRSDTINQNLVMDSEELLAIRELPRSLCIVGAGVIGMEFAGIFNSFGVDVTVVEYLKECLPVVDVDIAKRLRKLLEKQGIHFHMQSAVRSVCLAGQDDGVEVAFERKGRVETLICDKVLMAVGRAPRVTDDFVNAGFEYDAKHGIVVDNNMQTTVSGIYAVGDVNGRQMLAHAAEMQAVRAVNHILGRADNIRLDVMPSAVFTTPEVASVGLTEEQCKEMGPERYIVRKGLYRANGKAVAMNETDGMLKLIAEKESMRIVGAHCLGAHAADIVQEAATLMALDVTVGQLADIVHIHPTIGEILRDTAEAFL